MISRLETWWSVGVDSFAKDNGRDPADVPRELCAYVTASITDIKALDDAEGWAHGYGSANLRVTGGRVHMTLSWRLNVDRAAWAAVRGLDPRAGVRHDIAEHTAFELIHLPSVCETDAVMSARYATGRGIVRRTWTWHDRHPDSDDPTRPATTGTAADLASGARPATPTPSLPGPRSPGLYERNPS
ncbi:hypothetical protein [Streptomyces sp. NPDC053427]|uniref:hypothetical protein n=1 Tax=Streptomyces sp. NPDC053427 TaxID=3365701 RepID=UPI0037CD738D